MEKPTKSIIANIKAYLGKISKLPPPYNNDSLFMILTTLNQLEYQINRLTNLSRQLQFVTENSRNLVLRELETTRLINQSYDAYLPPPSDILERAVREARLSSASGDFDEN